MAAGAAQVSPRISVLPVPSNLLRTLALRRLRREKAVAALISLSLALAIAASFVVTAMTRTMVWQVRSRVKGPSLGTREEAAKEAAKGAAMIQAAAIRAFLPWHSVSLAAAVAAMAAISCVLAVSFVGRKRSLGVLKILGGTTRDLTRLLSVEALCAGAAGVPLGMGAGAAVVGVWLGPSALSFHCFLASAVFAGITLGFGVWLPMRLVRNANCAQLLSNRPVYAFSNPSCAKCGLCGGF